MYIDLMSEPDSKRLFALLLILGPRRAVFEERRGGRLARLVVVGVACRGRGFLRTSVLVEAKAK
jgi:hypothetical protein